MGQPPQAKTCVPPGACADPTTRFSTRVDDYVRYRPGYPPALFDFLATEAALGPGAAVADVGSGPGISAEPLLCRGFVVHGVEPNEPMRRAAEARLASFPNFRSVAAPAEATTLPEASVDLVLCAQAFHWFDVRRARAEFVRVLRPGGLVALVWNERKLNATPFLRAYEQLLIDCGTDYFSVRHENVTDASIARFFAPDPVRTACFPNAQSFDYDGLEGRLRSSSYAPPPGHPRYDEMVRRLHGLFDAFNEGGRVTISYETRVHVGRLTTSLV
jgi:SAM-dependent methyltransferase